MANTIRIKRSTTQASPTTLLSGELAFSYQSGKLFIGNSTSDGVIDLLSESITLATPITDFAPATENLDLNNNRIINLADPVNLTDAATKGYVDAARSGLDVKQSVRVATTTNINLASAPATIDGVTLNTGDRILVKNQTTASENGIYRFDNPSTALVRSDDANSSAEVTSGLFTFVSEGTTNADSGYVLTTDDPIVLDSTGLVFTQFSGAGQLEAGAGLSKTGNTLNIGTASASRIVINSDDIDLATIGTAGTYTKLTIDAYGRVSSGESPTTLAGYGITDAQPLNAKLSNLSSLTTSGLVYYDNNTTSFSGKNIQGSVDRITINETTSTITIDIASSYIGQNSITTLGTISTGIWNGSTIGIAYGGTGNTSFSTNRIPFSNGSILTSSANFTWNEGTTTLSVNGTIDNSTIDAGTF